MEHKTYRVISFDYIRPYTLEVTFDDGTKQTIDFRSILVGEIYGPFQDEKFFNQVEIDPEVHTLPKKILTGFPRYTVSFKKSTDKFSKCTVIFAN